MQEAAPPRLIFWGRLIQEPIVSRLRAVPGAAIEVVDSADALVAAMPGAAAIVMPGDTTSYTPTIAAALKERGASLRWLQLVTAGYDGLTLNGVRADVVVTLPGGNSRHVVAEHAMALLLCLARHIGDAVIAQQRATWDRSFAPRLTTLEERHLVIVGFGHIGKEIARRARAFDMRVTGLARHLASHEFADEMLPMTAWPAVLGEADALVLAVPLVPETRHLLDADALALCKPNLLVVNIGRGGLIDQAALIKALESGQIAGAGLDVTDPEPLSVDDPLWRAPNLIVTPHIGGAGSPRSRQLMADAIAANLQRFLAGEELQDVVSP